MSEWPDEFHDPALRSAIQRAEGKAAAPAQLRDKVTAMLAAGAVAGMVAGTVAESSPSSSSSSSLQKNRWRLPEMPKPTFRLAALAAVVFIAVGWAAMQIYDFASDGGRPGLTIARPSISTTLAASMVRTHNDSGKLADHNLPGDDLNALRPQLSSGAGMNAFASQIGDGWQFQSAGVYPINNVKAAGLYFTRDGQTASVFSMKADGGGCVGAECFAQMIDHRAVAAVSREGSLYGVVISQNGPADPSLAAAQGVLKTVELSVFGAAIDGSGAPSGGSDIPRRDSRCCKAVTLAHFTAPPASTTIRSA